ncbi:MAG: hypothetical protein M3Q73_04440 [bacterium]|nr:hypothetical protein [bacterium]
MGTFKNGLRNGKGTMGYANGKKYEGNWVDDKRSGYGEQTWAAGAEYISYKGNWENDTLHGEGTMLYSSGLIYSGQHANGKFMVLEK